MEKFEDFKVELRDLLNKYNASIFCDLDGDTHSLITTMIVTIDKKDFTLTKNGEIEAHDLK